MNRQQRRKYAKNINTPQKLEQYAKAMDNRLRKEYNIAYEEKYKQDLENSIDIFMVSIIYTLHFNEITNFNNDQVQDFMEDLLATIDNFNDGSYTPDEYRQILKKEGIDIVLKHKKKGD